MRDSRGKWVTPQLIVLGRGTPEENVLVGCKMSTLTGRNATKNSCKKKVGSNCNRGKCSAISNTS